MGKGLDYLMYRPTYKFESWLDVWKGLPCLILGRGKSTFDIPLADIDAFKEKGGKVIVVTELGRLEEYHNRADAWVFADVLTWVKCRKSMREYPGILWTTLSCYRCLGSRDPGPVSWVEAAQSFNFCPETPVRFGLGYTSSFLAAQLAWYAGADPIYFGGVDLRLLPDGRTHGDKDKPQCESWAVEIMYENQTKSFDSMAEFLKDAPRRVYKTSDWSLLPFKTKMI